jgi:hypothetical protein
MSRPSQTDFGLPLAVSLSAYRELIQENITVGTNAVLLGGNVEGRTVLCIFNNGFDAIYVGDSGVTTTNGFPLLPASYMIIDVTDEIEVYARAGSNQNVRIMELA